MKSPPGFVAAEAADAETDRLAGQTVRLQLLRTPQLWIDGAGARALNAADAALLALLAIDGPTTRARALALLCPDLDPPAARNLLRQRLFRLRRAAGIELVTRGELLALVDGIAHDLGDPARALAGDASAVFGDVLGEHAHDDLPAFADWLSAARARWRAQRRDALARIACRLEAERHIAAALVYAERLVGDEPLLEHAQRQLMRLHYRRGDRSAALAVHARCRDALAAQLGQTPDAETEALVALIERSSPLPGTQPAAPRPAALLRPPQRIGRDAEWQSIASACQHRRTSLISGEAGIGKSRLLGDAAATHGFLLVAARPGDARLPHALLGRLLRALGENGELAALAPWARDELARVMPELAAPQAGAIDAGRLQRATEHALTRIAPAGLAIDDLQFADAASVELVLALASADGSGPGWMFAVRADAALPVVDAWLLAEPGDRACLQLRLAPLTLAAVGQLLASLALPGFDAPRWAARVHRHAGGNPMFILETLAALRAAAGGDPAGLLDVDRLPLPDNLRLLIERRLQQLSPHALKLARVAALAGQDFNVELAAKVLAQHPLDLIASWAELEAAHVVDATAFVHDLVLEATQRSVPQPIAVWLHRAIAKALTEALAAGGQAPAARIAAHWFAAGAWAQAAEVYLQAARQTFDASRLSEAAPLYESAADAFERDGQPAEQHRALQALIGCHTKRHQLGEAKRLAARLRALARDVEQEAWALDRLGDIANMGRDDAEAETAVRAMLAMAGRSENRWIEFNATRKLAVVLAHRGRSEEGIQLFRSQQDWIEAHPAEWNVHVWFSDFAYVLDIADRRREAIAAADAVLAMARTHENWYVVYAATRNRALARHGQGDLQGALLDADAAWRLNDRLGDDIVRHSPREAARRAMLLRDDGQHAEAIALLEHGVTLLAVADSPFWRAYCEDQLALSYLAVGQHARARALLQGDVANDNVEARAMRAFVRTRWRQASGGGAAGVDASDEAGAIAADPACPRRWRWLIRLEACGLDMDQSGSEGAYAACLAIAREATAHEMPGIALHARLRAARAAIAAGDRRRAKADVQTALADWRANAVHPTGLSLPQFLWWAAEVQHTLGSRVEANPLLQLARRQLTEVELPQVPAPFRESFLQRQPVHRSLMAAATRWATG